MIIKTIPDPVSKREVLGNKTKFEIPETDSIAKIIDYYDTKITNQPTDPREIKFNRGHYKSLHGSILRFMDCVVSYFQDPDLLKL